MKIKRIFTLVLFCTIMLSSCTLNKKEDEYKMNNEFNISFENELIDISKLDIIEVEADRVSYKDIEELENIYRNELSKGFILKVTITGVPKQSYYTIERDEYDEKRNYTLTECVIDEVFYQNEKLNLKTGDIIELFTDYFIQKNASGKYNLIINTESMLFRQGYSYIFYGDYRDNLSVYRPHTIQGCFEISDKSEFETFQENMGLKKDIHYYNIREQVLNKYNNNSENQGVSSIDLKDNE